MAYWSRSRWRPYVPVARRRASAARMAATLAKDGRVLRPVEIEGRAISTTFWGDAWCENLESYSDYSNRLPRGRTYARNGSVIDLRIEAGRVSALVSGSSIYEVEVSVDACTRKLWKELCARCQGHIDSIVGLLEGSFSAAVMELMARAETGLFPSPRAMKFQCSCPDWAVMCKHVAAVLYGVGNRLDTEPELLFLLRKVDHSELIAAAGSLDAVGELAAGARDAVLETSDLAGVFGIELDEAAATPTVSPVPTKKPSRRGRRGSAKVPATKTSTKRTEKKNRPASAKRTSSKSVKKSATQPRAGKARARRGGGGDSANGDLITSRQLLECGVPHSTFQNWLRSGVMLRTAERGVYRTTGRTAECIARAVVRNVGAGRSRAK